MSCVNIAIIKKLVHLFVLQLTTQDGLVWQKITLQNVESLCSLQVLRDLRSYKPPVIVHTFISEKNISADTPI